MFTAFHFWMFVPQIWVIIAIIAILLELTDGSRIFFLPIGVAALLVAAHLQMTFSNIISASLLPETWYWLAMEWMFIAAVVSVLLLVYRKHLMPPRADDDDADINSY